MEGIKEPGQSPDSEMRGVDPPLNPFDRCGQGVLIDHFLEKIERDPDCADIRRNYMNEKDTKTETYYNPAIKRFIKEDPQIQPLIRCLCANEFINCTDRPKGYLTFVIHGRYIITKTCVGYSLNEKQLLHSTNITILAPIGQPNCGVEISRFNTNAVYNNADADLSRKTLINKTLLEGSASSEIFSSITEKRKNREKKREDEEEPDIYQLRPNITEDEIRDAIEIYVEKHPDKTNRDYLFKSAKRRANVINHPLSYISGNVKFIHEKEMGYSGKSEAIFLDGPNVSLRIKVKNNKIRKDLPYFNINLLCQYKEDGTADTAPTTNVNIINISHYIIDVIKELMIEICCESKGIPYSEKNDLKSQLTAIDGSCGSIEKQKCISPQTLNDFETSVFDSLSKTPFQVTQSESPRSPRSPRSQEGSPDSQPATQEYSTIVENIENIENMINFVEQKEEDAEDAKEPVIKRSRTGEKSPTGGARNSQRRRRNRLSTFREKSKLRTRMRSRVRSRAKRNSRTQRRWRRHNSSRSKRRK